MNTLNDLIERYWPIRLAKGNKMNTLNELIEMNKMMVAAEPNRIKCSCAWCGCVMPSKPGFSTENATSHGICVPCYAKAVVR